MQIWVGLGNPGAQYAMQRHNVGFMAVDAIAEVHGFDPPKKAFSGWTQQGRIGGQRILLLKPATFMNDSGRVGRARRWTIFKKDIGDVTVFHDELDLAPFKVKVKVGGGTAGHNGLRSTEAHIGNEFRRVRIGIGHPGHKDKVTSHVLGNYAKAEHRAAERRPRRNRRRGGVAGEGRRCALHERRRAQAAAARLSAGRSARLAMPWPYVPPDRLRLAPGRDPARLAE